MSIEKVAYFLLCKTCYLHARIVFADGAHTKPFTSKAEGHTIVSKAMSVEVISAEEAAFLTSEINNSPLLSEMVSEEEIDEKERLDNEHRVNGLRYMGWASLGADRNN